MLNTVEDSQTVPKTIVFCQNKDSVAKIYRVVCGSARSKSFVGMYHASDTEDKGFCGTTFPDITAEMPCFYCCIWHGMYGVSGCLVLA
jgi:hypothetical protein